MTQNSGKRCMPNKIKGPLEDIRERHREATAYYARYGLPDTRADNEAHEDRDRLLSAVDALMAFVKYTDHDFDKCDRDALVANFLQGHSGQGEFNCVCGFYDAFDALPSELKEALK